MNILEEKIKDLHYDVLRQTEEYLENFVDVYKPKTLTNEEFLSLYNIFYEVKGDPYMRGGEGLRLFLTIKLKTPEEFLMEIDDGDVDG